MADIAKHAGSGVSINGVVESGIVTGSVAVNPKKQSLILNASGALLPTFGAVVTSAPMFTFRTRNINLITAPTVLSSTGVILSARAYTDGGALGTGYVSLAAAKGLICPVSLSAQKGAAAELELAVYGVSKDGDTDPLAVSTTSNTLGVNGDTHTLGTLFIVAEITGVQNLNLNFGYNILTNEGENGKTYPTLAWSQGQQAVISAVTQALSAATQARLNYGQSVAAYINFRKLVEGGVVTDTGKVTATLTKALVTAESVNAGPPFATNIQITPIYDGAGDDYLVFS